MSNGPWTSERVLLIAKPFFDQRDFVPGDMNDIDKHAPNLSLHEELKQNLIPEGSIELRLHEFFSDEETQEMTNGQDIQRKIG